MPHTVVELGSREWWVVSTPPPGNLTYLFHINRYTGELVRDKETAPSHKAGVDRVTSKSSVVSEIKAEALVGYVVAGNCGLLLLVTKSDPRGRLPNPGGQTHVIRTVLTSQWVAIPLVDPLLHFSNACDLLDTADDTTPSSPTEASGKRRIPAVPNRCVQETAAAAILKEVVLDGHHFWCDTHDLTRHWVKTSTSPTPAASPPAASPPAACPQSLWDEASSEYVWNRRLSEPFRQNNLQHCCCVLLRGMCTTNVLSTTANGNTVSCTLITRQRNLNPGSRYEARGLHAIWPGVGNEYECEQIVFHRLRGADGIHARPFGIRLTKNLPSPNTTAHPEGEREVYSWTSFVWSRGTVPLRWTSRLKSTNMSATILMDKRPYSGVYDYWKGVWSRYGTDNFMIINLLRNLIPSGVGVSQAPDVVGRDSPEATPHRSTTPPYTPDSALANSIPSSIPTISLVPSDAPPPLSPSLTPSPVRSPLHPLGSPPPIDTAWSLASLTRLSSLPAGEVQLQEMISRRDISTQEAAAREADVAWMTRRAQPRLYVLAPAALLHDGLWAIRKKPSRQATKVGSLRAGDVVEISEEAGGWLRLANGMGWTMARSDRHHGAGLYPLPECASGMMSSSRKLMLFRADVSEQDREQGIEDRQNPESDPWLPASEDDEDDDDGDDDEGADSDEMLLDETLVNQGDDDDADPSPPVSPNLNIVRPTSPRPRTPSRYTSHRDPEGRQDDAEEKVAEPKVGGAAVASPRLKTRRMHTLREQGVTYRGETLLGYQFESSLHALDRYLQRIEWTAAGQPLRPQPLHLPGDSPRMHHTQLRHFDWHGIVKKHGEKKSVEMFWALIAPSLREYGVSSGLYYQAAVGKHTRFRIDSVQKGVHRFNCADSLDRTNLCCFMASLHVLAEQYRLLASAADLSPEDVDDTLQESDTCLSEKARKEDKESLAGSPWPLLSQSYDAVMNEVPRSILALHAGAFVENGDICALCYCNSPAMHSGLLRSFAGESFQKQQKSNVAIAISRRFQNQFTDSRRTKSINLLLGRHWGQHFPSVAVPHAYPRLKEEEAASSFILIEPPHTVEAGERHSLLSPEALRSALESLGPLTGLLYNVETSNSVPSANTPLLPVALAIFQKPMTIPHGAIGLKWIPVASEEYIRYEKTLVEYLLSKEGSKKERAKLALQQVRNTLRNGEIVKNVKGGIAKKFQGFRSAVKGRMGMD